FDLALELDAEAIERPPPRLGHQRKRVLRAGSPCVLDEVRVPRRDERVADAIAPEPALVEHPARAELVSGVLEDAPEGALVRRLGRFAQRLKLRHTLPDVVLRARAETELDLSDDLPRFEARMAVGEVEFIAREPTRAGGVDDQRTFHDRSP